MQTVHEDLAKLETVEIQAERIRTAPLAKLQNLLVAYDFSDPADRALSYAREFARRFGSRIILASIETPAELSEALESGVAGEEQASEVRDLEQIAYGLHLQDIRSSAVRRVGSPSDVLVELAAELKPDLIFMGAYSHSAAERSTLGSTTEFLLRSLNCPTLTVGPSVPALGHSSLFPAHAIYASNAPAHHGRAEFFVRDLATRCPLHVHIVHVEPSNRLLFDCGHLTELQIREVGIANRFRAAGIPSSWTIQYGDQAEKILEQARQTHADLIVFGIEHPPTDSRHMGILTTLIRNARCPVLTVHGTA
jgi:nucleotide-binding universal stress UspA family protein